MSVGRESQLLDASRGDKELEEDEIVRSTPLNSSRGSYIMSAQMKVETRRIVDQLASCTCNMKICMSL